jgi:hypothetical protein
MWRSALIFGMSVVALAVVAPAARAATNDFAPADGPVGGWGLVTDTNDFAALDNTGKFLVLTVKYVTVDANLIATHVQTKKPTNLAHLHFAADFTAAQVTKANAFWNWFFDAPATTTKKTDATDVTNCYITALGSTGNGIYNYWINTDSATTGFADDTDSIAKAKVFDGDLLFYKTQDHASIMKTLTTTGSPAVTTYTIRWKNNASGIYEYVASGLDTPGMTATTFTVGAAPTGTWALNGIGKEANLDPAGDVHRKK